LVTDGYSLSSRFTIAFNSYRVYHPYEKKGILSLSL
jgi:hypothetical protein